MNNRSDLAKIRQEISRRNLLRFLGNSAVALPFMRTLLETQAFGQSMQKRAVIFYWPNGTQQSEFHPDTVGSNFVLKKITKPLESVRSDIIIPKGINYKTGGSHEHGMNYCLTGWGTIRENGEEKIRPDKSIDTVLGEHLGQNSAEKVLRLGAAAMKGDHTLRDYFNWASYLGRNQHSYVEDNPTKSFNSLFGTPEPPTDGRVGLSKAMRKSVLDASLSDLKGLQNAIGSIEKEKLDMHVESVFELERRLSVVGPDTTNPACTKSLRNTRTFGPDDYQAARSTEAYGDVVDLNIEIALQAMACGVRNVIYIQNSQCVSLRNFTGGMPSANASQGNHHELSHYGSDLRPDVPRDVKEKQYTDIQAWYMTKLAKLLEGMKSIKEGDKSVLYNSGVLALSEFGNANEHGMNNVGIILAGQAGGYFKTGQCVDVGRDVYHNRLLVSFMQAFGVAGETFGDPEGGKGSLASLRS